MYLLVAFLGSFLPGNTVLKLLAAANRSEPATAPTSLSLSPVAKTAEGEQAKMEEGSIKDGLPGLSDIEYFPLVGHLPVAESPPEYVPTHCIATKMKDMKKEYIVVNSKQAFSLPFAMSVLMLYCKQINPLKLGS